MRESSPPELIYGSVKLKARVYIQGPVYLCFLAVRNAGAISADVYFFFGPIVVIWRKHGLARASFIRRRMAAGVSHASQTLLCQG